MSVAELKDAILDYLNRHNADPKPFVWTKTAEAILEKEWRALDRLEAIQPGTNRQSRNTSGQANWPRDLERIERAQIGYILNRILRGYNWRAEAGRACNFAKEIIAVSHNQFIYCPCVSHVADLV
jgi:hypothetical protein